MRRVRLFHWNATEAQPIVNSLRAAKFTVDYPNEKALEPPFRQLRETRPDVIAIDLTRLPSRGRNQAVAIRLDESLRTIPIVFIDGDPKKVAAIRSELPDALYTSRAELRRTLQKAQSMTNPASPVYNKRTIAQKLGIRDNMRIGIFDGFKGYENIIGILPAGASFEEEPQKRPPVTIFFVREPGEFLTRIATMRSLAGQSRVWAAYPKKATRQKAGAEISLGYIRETAANFGLTHYKTCALGNEWTGIALALSKRASSSRKRAVVRD